MDNGPDFINNTSILVLNRYRRHMSFVDSTHLLDICRRAGQYFPDQEAACNFVTNTPSCTDIVQRINYLKLMVCYLGVGVEQHLHMRMMLISIVIIALYTLFAYVLGKYFILPNVLYIASYMQLRSFEYGLLIGFLISAPDFINIIVVCAKYSANGTLILSGMMGRALSCYAIGMSVIAFRQGQCRLPGVRYTSAMLLTLAANIFTVFVLCYKLDIDSSQHSEYQSSFNIKYCATFMILLYLFLILFLMMTSRRESRTDYDPEKEEGGNVYLIVRPKDLKGWRLFTYPLIPFTNVPHSPWIIAFLSPFWVLSALQVPVIDLKRPLNGWSKYLACISVLVVPWHFWMLKMPNIFVYITIFLTAFAILALVLLTNANRPPRYYGLFSVLGIIIGFSLYHIIDLEVNVLLYQVFAFTADVHLDITSTVAFSTCFVIFTIIFCQALMDMHQPNLASGIVVGISMNQSFTALPSIIFQFCYDLQMHVVVSSHTQTCYVFLVVTIVVSLLSALMTNFLWHPSHGGFMVAIYICFVVVVFFGGYDLIHPYGTHHAVTEVFGMEHATWA